MTLDEIKPCPISSAIKSSWNWEIATWAIAIAIILPPIAFNWPYKWAFVALAFVVGVAAKYGSAHLAHWWRVKWALTPPREFPTPPEFDAVERAQQWVALLRQPEVRSIVLFAYGTCVVSVDADADPAATAKSILQQYGHAIPGTASADMLVYTLPVTGDFVIGCHVPNILTYVPRNEFSSDISHDQLQNLAALLGRLFRTLDAFKLNPIHTHIFTNPDIAE